MFCAAAPPVAAAVNRVRHTAVTPPLTPNPKASAFSLYLYLHMTAVGLSDNKEYFRQLVPCFTAFGSACYPGFRVCARLLDCYSCRQLVTELLYMLCSVEHAMHKLMVTCACLAQAHVWHRCCIQVLVCLICVVLCPACTRLV